MEGEKRVEVLDLVRNEFFLYDSYMFVFITRSLVC